MAKASVRDAKRGRRPVVRKSPQAVGYSRKLRRNLLTDHARGLAKRRWQLPLIVKRLMREFRTAKHG